MMGRVLRHDGLPCPLAITAMQYKASRLASPRALCRTFWTPAGYASASGLMPCADTLPQPATTVKRTRAKRPVEAIPFGPVFTRQIMLYHPLSRKEGRTRGGRGRRQGCADWGG